MVLSFSLCTTTLILCFKFKILKYDLYCYVKKKKNVSIIFICFDMSLKYNKIRIRKNLENVRAESICLVLLRHLGTEFWSKTLVVYNFRHYWLFCVVHLLMEKAGIEFDIC